MNTTALRWITCLCALGWLAGCSANPSKALPAPHPQVIEVPVPAYRALPAALTLPLAEPTPPATRCTWLGVSTQCAGDGLVWIDAWRGVLQQCNADRATSAKLSDGEAP